MTDRPKRIPVEDVAQIIRSLPTPHGAAEAIAAKYGVPRGTASYWIHEARKRGLLPAAGARQRLVRDTCKHGHSVAEWGRYTSGGDGQFYCLRCRLDTRASKRPVRVLPTIQERILAAVDQSTGCWIWLQSLGSTGYGQIHYDGTNRPLHRVSYEAFVGPIPDGLELDHLCRVPACCNPQHLEPVTHTENMRRSVAARRIEAARAVSA